MPEQNPMLEKLDIPAYNNLLTAVGYSSYHEVLIKHQSNQPPKDLTPMLFKGIVNREINQYSVKHPYNIFN